MQRIDIFFVVDATLIYIGMKEAEKEPQKCLRQYLYWYLLLSISNVFVYLCLFHVLFK